MFKYSHSIEAPALAASRAAFFLAEASRLLGALVERALEWQDRSRQRLGLLALDDHLLKDVGLTRAQAYRETRKPFWRA
jgi:uncharacterized protein YjiS (DUF1127 family)